MNHDCNKITTFLVWSFFIFNGSEKAAQPVAPQSFNCYIGNLLWRMFMKLSSKISNIGVGVAHLQKICNLILEWNFSVKFLQWNFPVLMFLSVSPNVIFFNIKQNLCERISPKKRIEKVYTLRWTVQFTEGITQEMWVHFWAVFYYQ